MNYRGKINELGLKIELTSNKVGGTDHEPLFQTTIIYDGKTYKGNIEKDKKSSIQVACKYLLDHIHIQDTNVKNVNNLNNVKRRIDNDIPTLYLVDLENIPKHMMEIEAGKNTVIYACLSQRHALLEKRNLYSFPIEEIPSSRKNACDVALILEAYKGASLFKKIILITRDKFAEPLKEILEKGYPDIELSIQTNILF